MDQDNEKVVLRFVKPSPPYNSGEVAGFPPAQARAYLDAGIAHLEGEPEPVEETPPPSNPPGPGKQDDPPAVDNATHELSVDDVGKLAETITDPATIAALIAGEKAHPKFQDGRKGALEFLELRALELAEPPKD